MFDELKKKVILNSHLIYVIIKNSKNSLSLFFFFFLVLRKKINTFLYSLRSIILENKNSSLLLSYMSYLSHFPFKVSHYRISSRTQRISRILCKASNIEYIPTYVT